jgi:hypothetical protein
MDRNAALREARELAATIVGEHGRDGLAETFFMHAADQRFASQLGSKQLLDVWREAIGIDKKSGLRPGVGG